MTNEYNFKVGDRVQVRPDYTIGEIIEISGDPTNLRYCVKFDTGICASYYKNEIKLVDDKPYDRRTAFLTELQALLRKYDARIEPYFSVCADIPSIDLYFGNDCVESWDRPVTADNIMDF